MADVFVSYARADQELVRRVVALLEAQGWSVWWDTRINGGERWDEVIERELKAARCVVVVWTPRSIDRYWVRLEAHDGRKRGILVPVLIGVDEQPFGFSLIQARDLTGWNGAIESAAVAQFLADVRQQLHGAEGASPAGGKASAVAPHPADDFTFWERQWEKHGASGNLVVLHVIKEGAPRIFADHARARIAEIEAEQRRQAEEQRRVEEWAIDNGNTCSRDGGARVQRRE